MTLSNVAIIVCTIISAIAMIVYGRISTKALGGSKDGERKSPVRTCHRDKAGKGIEISKTFAYVFLFSGLLVLLIFPFFMRHGLMPGGMLLLLMGAVFFNIGLRAAIRHRNMYNKSRVSLPSS